MGKLSARSQARGLKVSMCGVAILALAMSAAPAGAATATVPGAPTIKSVKPSGDRAILVTIAKPASDGGSRISSYRAVCSSKNGGVTGADVATSSPVHVSRA